jgi:predicted ester cyclase
MSKRRIFVSVCAAALGMAGAQALAGDAPQTDSAYEALIRKNTHAFHIAFSAHEFAKNGDLVADDVHVDANGVELHGRDTFVKHIARFVGPFPDVKIDDQITLVDGNQAAVRFVITGTHEGDLQTPNGVLHATHRKIKVDGAEFFTFDQQGKLVDLIQIENLTQLAAQLKGAP